MPTAGMSKLLRQETYLARAQRAASTPAERLLWRLLRGRALGAKFRRQQPLGPYIADFFCHDAGLVVEVDGAVHDDPAQRAHDAQRDLFLAACGLRVLRIRNETILYTPKTALALVRAALAEPTPLPPGEGQG